MDAASGHGSAAKGSAVGIWMLLALVLLAAVFPFPLRS